MHDCTAANKDIMTFYWQLMLSFYNISNVHFIKMLSWWHVTFCALCFNLSVYSHVTRRNQNRSEGWTKRSMNWVSLKSQQQQSTPDKLLTVSPLLLCLQGKTLIKRPFLLTNMALCLVSKPSQEIGSYLFSAGVQKGYTCYKNFHYPLGHVQVYTFACMCVHIAETAFEFSCYYCQLQHIGYIERVIFTNLQFDVRGHQWMVFSTGGSVICYGLLTHILARSDGFKLNCPMGLFLTNMLFLLHKIMDWSCMTYLWIVWCFY